MRGILRLLRELFRFNFVDRRARIGKRVRIDHFVVIEHGVEIGNNTWIGSWTHIRPGTKIGYGSEVRDQCYVAGNGVIIGNRTKVLQKCNIAQGTEISDECFLSAGVITSNTRKIMHCRNGPAISVFAHIGHGTRVGIGAVILGVTIAPESYIGAGAVVTKDTDQYGIYVGNPAKKIGEVPQEERII